ncbi:glutathione S-transferase [Aulographum hederae CBS 113979]|uniref:glutathione transferase n=1 Tax=Aulographum hederae CBS 113979 TaxID=1176131 RepID=A0A6G1H034_9PEZI|nr:glutathione S-transferase [Aulographum hederae CBS 113979]
MAKITLHWLDKSRSHRILWLLEELKVDYDLKIYKRGSDMLAPPELKKVHALGKSPVIEVQASEGDSPIIIAESGAIVEYLSDHLGPQLIPKRYPEGKENQLGAETKEWLRYRQLMHYAEGSLMGLLVIALIMISIKNAPVPFFIKPLPRMVATRVEQQFLNRNFKTHFDFLEDQLATSGGDFFCGTDLSGADILLIFPLEAARGRTGLDSEKYPKLCAYVDRIHERDAYKRAVKKIEDETGEPFSLALG